MPLSSLSGLALACGLAFASPLSKRSVPAGVPSFALDYAPLLRLHPQESYRPASLSTFLTHVTPKVSFSTVSNLPALTLDNLDILNANGGSQVYLTSNDDVTEDPAWLNGEDPSSAGTDGGRSVVIVVDKGNGAIDVFYFWFYAFDYGGQVLGFNVGDHIGDWEHNMVRFQNGLPQAMWFSQHSDGEAFAYPALEKDGLRPISYCANGTHANYAAAGTFGRVIPGLDIPGLFLNDYTSSAGQTYDPLLSSYFVSYDTSTSSFTSYDDGTTPTAFLNFVGQWGDQQYPDADPRQVDILDLGLAYKFVSGPTGPLDKNLNRQNVCPDSDDECIIKEVVIN